MLISSQTIRNITDPFFVLMVLLLSGIMTIMVINAWNRIAASKHRRLWQTAIVFLSYLVYAAIVILKPNQ